MRRRSGNEGQFFSNLIETQLREKNSQIEQLLRQEAGDGADAASNAKASADAAGVASGKAKREADDVAKQAEQLHVDLAKEDAEAKKLQAFVMDRANDRRLKLDIRTMERLLPLPPAKAEILYRETDAEARRFALNIWFALGEAEGLWKVGDAPIPLTEEHFTEGGEAFAVGGVKIIDKQVELRFFGPSITLSLPDAISAAKLQGLSEDEAKRLAILIVGTGATDVSKDPTLPDNFFKIIVCTREPVEGNPLR